MLPYFSENRFYNGAQINLFISLIEENCAAEVCSHISWENLAKIVNNVGPLKKSAYGWSSVR